MLLRLKKASYDVPTLTDVEGGGPLAAKPDLHKTSPRAKIHSDPSLRDPATRATGANAADIGFHHRENAREELTRTVSAELRAPQAKREPHQK